MENHEPETTISLAVTATSDHESTRTLLFDGAPVTDHFSGPASMNAEEHYHFYNTHVNSQVSTVQFRALLCYAYDTTREESLFAESSDDIGINTYASLDTYKPTRNDFTWNTDETGVIKTGTSSEDRTYFLSANWRAQLAQKHQNSNIFLGYQLSATYPTYQCVFVAFS